MVDKSNVFLKKRRAYSDAVMIPGLNMLATVETTTQPTGLQFHITATTETA